MNKVEDVSLEEFSKLKENDILFIDSSHNISIGNDVYYEYLEILPRLKKGVLIHVHDIFLPYEYPKKWIFEYLLFWSEQYLLQAFLSFNNNFEILWGGYYMHKKHPDLLKNNFGSYNEEKNNPGSFWFKRTK
ncbi:hypothetical protein ES703_68161 [subsurface metagenome]